MATLYDNLIGGRGGVINYNAGATTDYPTSDQYNVFPALYLPRVYGKDLSAFEIASSGKISVTIRDVYSFDLERNLASSNVILQTMSNDSFQISVNQSNMGLQFDSKSNVIKMTSSNQIALSATSNITLQSQALTLQMSQLDLLGDTINVIANSNLNLQAIRDSVRVSTGSNIIIASSNNTTFSACNNFSVSALSNYTVSADNGNIRLAMNAATDSLTLAARSNVTVSAGNSNMILTMDAATNQTSLNSTNTVTISTSNNVLVSASSNVAVGANTGSATIYANRSNVSLIMDSTTNNMTLYSSNLMSLNTSNSVAVRALSNVSVGADYGSATIYANQSNVSLVMDSTTNKMTLYSSNDLTVNTSNSMFVNTTSNYTLKASSGAVSLNALGGKTYLALNSNIVLFGSNNSLLQTVGTTTIDGSQVFIKGATGKIDIASDKLQVYSSQSVTLGTSNDFTVTASSNAQLTAQGTTTINAQGGSTYIAMGTGGITENASKYTFNVANNSMVEIDSAKMRINGNLEVLGVLDNISIQQTMLDVQDKIINLARTSNNGNPEDGIANNLGGLVLRGIPQGYTSNDAALFEKSIRWNVAGGMPLLGTAAYSNDPYWEVKGGGLKLTHTKIADKTEVSFGFRINEFDELEIVKKYTTDAGSNYQFKRIAKFGRTIL